MGLYRKKQEEIRDFIEVNENEYATCTISWNTKKMKLELRRKSTAQNVYKKRNRVLG